MSDIKLFRIQQNTADELSSHYPALEKTLQNLIENNLESLLGIRFLASEFSTGKEHGGRIDTLGIDENNCPVIIEYKLSSNENVINQGLFYLSWLLDHKKDFEWLVMDKFGEETAKNIEWSVTRLLCIARDFTKYDEHAIKQIGRNVELIRYRYFSDNLLLFELVNPVINNANNETKRNHKAIENKQPSNKAIPELYKALEKYIMSLGTDVQLNALKHYNAFRRIRNFACVEVMSKKLILWLNVNPQDIILEDGYTRDVRNIGHHGTGALEVKLHSISDLHKAMGLIQQSYENS